MMKKANTSAVVMTALALAAVLFTPTVKAQISTGSAPFSVAIDDLDGDTNLDMVYGHNGNSVCYRYGNGDGTFGDSNCVTGLGVNDRFVAIKDVTGDGKPDIIVADFGRVGGNGIWVLVNNGDRTFTRRGIFSSGPTSQPRALVVADFDGDGKQDVVTANWGSRSIAFLKGNGDGTFAAPQITTGVGQVHGIATGDFNGDNKADIAVAEFGNGSMPTPDYGMRVWVLLGNGDGTFRTPVAYQVGLGPRILVSADVNADGCPDLASANLAGNSVSVLVNNCDGSGTFRAALNIPIAGQPFGLAGGDIASHGDGTDDLVVTSNATSMLTSLVSNGDGTFADPVSQATGGLKSRFVALGDINNDNILDALVVNNGSNNITVFIGNGDGTFTSP